MAEQWRCAEVIDRGTTPQFNSQLDLEDVLRSRRDLSFLQGSEQFIGDEGESLPPPPLRHCLAEIVEIIEDSVEGTDGTVRTVRTRCELGHWAFGAADGVLIRPSSSGESSTQP